MQVITPILLGFAVAFLTTLLPGLLNMTAAKISLKEGRKNAMVFAGGAAVIVFIQAFIAVTFAKLINRRPDIVYLLEEVGVLIFFVLTVYFLFLSKKKKPKAADDVVKIRSKTGNFFIGMALSALNFFPIPFYVFISISLSAAKIFFFTNLYILLFVAGAMSGAFLVFYLYIIFFKKFEHKTDFFLRNVNYFIGAITGIVAIVTLLRIWKSHY
ncbi:LysE family transporter [Flavobacterium sp. Sd200]|uniref:LysE family transporter n=1 Tax=Flavobacterium sp. Sd200 TaxID=2692211 RepID=UPI0013688A59|nr:LysE family transporter [Flavobacterium sp. Sd200]MXN92155.1 LysE family transporter [Flavobacterium sp. Sd200]